MSDMITSPSNPKLRYVRNLDHRAFRARERRVRLEGMRLVETALDLGAHPSFVLASETLMHTDRGRALRQHLAELGVPVLDVEPTLFGKVADTEHPQGVLAVVPAPEVALPATLDLVLVLDGLRDPGNLGTVLRTALAAGVDAVLLGPGTVDPTNPKVVRAAMGAHFALAVARADWARIAEVISGLTTWVADAGGETPYDAVDWRMPSAIVVSGEAHGASAAAKAAFGRTVRIPMPGAAESLNAAVAAGILLFEVVRQRSAGPSPSGSTPERLRPR